MFVVILVCCLPATKGRLERKGDGKKGDWTGFSGKIQRSVVGGVKLA
jgi:hypothetical protein